ncbi:hypothetical protein BU17DRAFT_83677 [Hysterangium stoloniferum]|nr:hypothetical protein BU17DRAFT_83677 [Hysterangium stoloniferum]
MSDREIVLSHPDQVEVLPPLISPAALEAQQIAVLESHFQDMLQRLWACNREGHGLCYHRPGHEHVSITKDTFDSWVQQLCRGFATFLEPPQGLLDSSGIGQGMSDIEREAMTRWFAPVIRNPTDVKVGPGYFCDLAMERIGTKLLGSITVAATVHGCLQPEALSFATSTDGDHKPRQQDPAPCPKTPKQSVTAILEALLTPHELASKTGSVISRRGSWK